MVHRRAFLKSATGVALGLQGLYACAARSAGDQPVAARSGAAARSSLALQPDPAGILDLPEGFSYRVLSRAGDRMSDGLFEPDSHDGMAAFAVDGDPDRCLIVRNHEIGASRTSGGAFGRDHALANGLDSALIFDRAADGRPLLGGTTTLLVNTRTGTVERSHLSLAGTATNCAGGPTPWGSWLTCEETQERPGANAQKMHGFVFEVPASAPGLVAPVALTAMGRFRHEATAIDPATGIVYLTEDEGDGLFYRFLPNSPGELARGGRLQALVVRDRPGADTRNWSSNDFALQTPYAVDWVDLKDVDAPDGDLRLRGRKAGAALFTRGEGCATAIENGRAVIYFVTSDGGPAKIGQVWRHVPSEEAAGGGVLSLFVEGRSSAEFEMIDNIAASPFGHLVLCEDGPGDNFLRAVTPSGRVIPLARNAMPEKSELAGACFAPDGRTMFVNIQRPGITLAITGDWTRLTAA
ncbi:DUF839 domain-containing protein [bacterium]|nr:DUF839 domain-containing protein [bacterium]